MPDDVRDADTRLEALLARFVQGTPTVDEIATLGRLAGAARAELRERARVTLEGLERQLMREVFEPGVAEVKRWVAVRRDDADPAYAPLRAVAIAKVLLLRRADPDPDALREDLASDDRVRQYAALCLVRDLTGAERRELTDAVCRLFGAEAESHPALFGREVLDLSVVLRAARLALELPVTTAQRTTALCVLLDEGVREDRETALRAAAVVPETPWTVRVRVVRAMSAADGGEALAAVLALGAIGLPPRAEWTQSRSETFRRMAAAKDPKEFAELRARLDWRGPTEADAVPVLARLARDTERPAVARAAAAVLVRLERD